MTNDLHPRLAEILASCPSYYNAVAGEYVALLARGERGSVDPREAARVAMRDCFYVAVPADVPASFIAGLADEPTRGERMLVRTLARIPSI